MVAVETTQTVFEVGKDRFDVARHLFDEIWFDTAFIGAAFDGLQPARLFVDGLERPSAAMLARKLGFVELPPFSQLSPPQGEKIGESTGLWPKELHGDGIIAYHRNRSRRQ